MSTTDFERALLALALWREARSQGLEGMTAVGCCLRNRLEAWGKSWLQVLTGKNQLSSMTVVGDSQTVVFPEPHDPLFSRLLARVDQIAEGTIADTTGGALYYANLNAIDKHGWFARNITAHPDLHPQVAVVGAHHFFK